MVGRISALYMKNFTGRGLVVCLPSYGSHPARVWMFLGAASNFGRTTGLEVSRKGKVEVELLKPLTAHEAEQPHSHPGHRPLHALCGLKLQGSLYCW